MKYSEIPWQIKSRWKNSRCFRFWYIWLLKSWNLEVSIQINYNIKTYLTSFLRNFLYRFPRALILSYVLLVTFIYLFLHVFHSSPMSGRIFEHFPLSSIAHLLFCQVVLFACFHLAYPSSSSPRSMLGMDNPQSGFMIDIAADESENRYYIGVCPNSRIMTVYISKRGDPVSRLIYTRQIIIMIFDKSFLI